MSKALHDAASAALVSDTTKRAIFLFFCFTLKTSVEVSRRGSEETDCFRRLETGRLGGSDAF